MSHLEQLLTDSSPRSFLISLTAVVLIGLFAGYLLQADYQQQYQFAEQRNRQLELSISALKQNAKTDSVVQIFTPMTVAPAFSVIEILKKSGGRLINWQPGAQQAKLELVLDWQKVPRFFRHLSDYQGINLTSFTINATQYPMTVALILVFSYENT